MRGIDYAWHGEIDWNCLKAQGVTFICRYFSWDQGKDLTPAELHAANTNGISVVVVWETTANRMLGGYNAGAEDAHETNVRLSAYGMDNAPAYFACDWDASEAEQQVINSYLNGAASVMGLARVGMYAGYYPLKRAWDAGKLTYGWQTYAWSGGHWDNRAQLRQVQNGVTVCGISADWDESMAPDFAQWPRPYQQEKPPSQEAKKDMALSVVIPPGTGVEESNDIGVSFPGANVYKTIGFCCDPGRLGNSPVMVRVALHWLSGGWQIHEVEMTDQHPKVVIQVPPNVDGCSFRRQDDTPIDLIPNFL